MPFLTSYIYSYFVTLLTSAVSTKSYEMSFFMSSDAFEAFFEACKASDASLMLLKSFSDAITSGITVRVYVSRFFHLALASVGNKGAK